jgi:hypothetical protein
MRPSDLFVGKAVRVRGSHTDSGMALLRPGYVVFVPKGSKHLTGYGASGTMMPQAFHDLGAYVGYLQTLPEDQFDGTIDEAVRQCGWSKVALGAARVVKRRGLFRRSRVTLAIEGDGGTIRFDGPLHESSVPDVEAMLART